MRRDTVSQDPRVGRKDKQAEVRSRAARLVEDAPREVLREIRQCDHHLAHRRVRREVDRQIGKLLAIEAHGFLGRASGRAGPGVVGAPARRAIASGCHGVDDEAAVGVQARLERLAPPRRHRDAAGARRASRQSRRRRRRRRAGRGYDVPGRRSMNRLSIVWPNTLTVVRPHHACAGLSFGVGTRAATV